MEKKVRILGFNHDELAEPTEAYVSATKTGKAGISFEYVDFLTSIGMNSSNTNLGGWKEAPLRGTLNGTRGYAITTEGKQYKYYKMKLGSTKYNSSNNITKKPSVSNSNWWWLRSPDYHGSSGFCYVQSSGYCIYNYARYYVGVTPGFSI